MRVFQTMFNFLFTVGCDYHLFKTIQKVIVNGQEITLINDEGE